MIALMTLVGMSSAVLAQTPQQMPNPLDFVKKAIPHGTPIARWKDFDNAMIATFWKNQQAADIISQEIADACKKHKIQCKFVFRGNMIDFTFSKDSLVMTNHLWFRPEESEGARCIQYKMGTWSSGSDPWMLHNTATWKQVKADPVEDFRAHANIVMHMMKMDIWIPHLLTTRLSYDLQYGKDYVTAFKAVAIRNGLKIKEKKGSVWICNPYHDYLIVSAGVPQPTFEVTPKWSETK
jgi:hypothetical protein